MQMSIRNHSARDKPGETEVKVKMVVGGKGEEGEV